MGWNRSDLGVIPGCAFFRCRPGIHNPSRAYGFRARFAQARSRPGTTAFILVRHLNPKPL
jgi:hypothetical protein